MPKDAFMPKSTWVVGRGYDCDLVVTDAAVSSHHCRLTQQGDGFQLEAVTLLRQAAMMAGDGGVGHYQVAIVPAPDHPSRLRHERIFWHKGLGVSGGSPTVARQFAG